MRFERENNLSYLVLDESNNEMESGSQKDECSDIEYKMIKNNSIEGLLPMQQRVIDGREIYYYDITSKQQMSKLYSYVQIRLEDVLMICESIALMVQNINMYMLDLAKVRLEAEYMYVDISEKKVEFVYYPYRQQENGCDESIMRLFEYILEHFDHSVEKEQLMTMYMIYQKVVQKEYNLETFNELVKECSMEIQREEKRKEQDEKQEESNGEELSETFVKFTEREKFAKQEEFQTEKRNWDNQTQERSSDKIQINAVPAENIDDEVEIKNEKLLKYQKLIKAISIGVIILGILKILVPGIVPLPIDITASALMIVIGTVVLAGVSAIPQHVFVKMQPRRRVQKYEVPFEQNFEDKQHKDNENLSLESQQARQIQQLQQTCQPQQIQNMQQAQQLQQSQQLQRTQEPQTMLLSDYINSIKSGSGTFGKITLVSQETREMLEIIKFPCLIGSMAESCDKVISEKLISRLHCCIDDSKEGYYIEDMNSTNGTFVNEERLVPNNRHILNNGDKVRLATYVYEVEIS